MPGWATVTSCCLRPGQRASGSRSLSRSSPERSQAAGDIGNPAEVDQQGILVLVIDVERFLSAEAFLDGIEE